MGFECEVRKVFSFTYYVELENGFFEHEYDHVFIGQFDGSPKPSPDEVEDWKWMDLATLRIDMQESPEDFTYWFKLSFDTLCKHVWSTDVLGTASIVKEFQNA
jgi:isopentenyl-diphosphate delta-isomerase